MPKQTIHEFEFNLGGGVTDTFITSNALEAAYVQKYLAADIILHTEFGASDSSDNGRPVYRFLNKESGDHFYTQDANEMREIAKQTKFIYEGIGFYAFSPGVESTNFERFFNPSTGAHEYTEKQEEVDELINRGFISEGVAWSLSAESESVSQPTSSNINQSPDQRYISDPTKRYLALCGGGFNTHTMLSGFFSGVLDGLSAAGIGTLDGMMCEVDEVSANTGAHGF